MPDGRDVIYRYDRTFDGLLCCVFESYMRREIPLDIIPDDTPQLPLYPVHDITTTSEGAQRVFLSIGGKLGNHALELIQQAFWSGTQGKELIIFQFIRLGYRVGPRVVDMLADSAVSTIHKLSLAVTHEAHLLTGFLRFSDYADKLVAVIEPKHFVLPLMQPHFCDRFSCESFLIYDQTNGVALIHQPREWRIVTIDSLILPDADETELQYRRLWKQYFETIAIRARCNPRCQMGHMPKRFWQHLTEMQPCGDAPAGKPNKVPTKQRPVVLEATGFYSG